MKDILIIMKKELVRFLTDKRMVATLFLPGILIYVMYSLMGGLMDDALGVDEDHVPVVLTVNSSDVVKGMLETVGAEITEVTDIEEAKNDITDNVADVLLIFSENFDASVMSYDLLQGKAPDVQVFYNSSSVNSSQVYTTVYSVLDAYEGSLANKFDVNANPDTVYDLASEEDIAAMFYSMLMPMLLLMLLFTGASAITPEAIAGEKERGTMATLLVTPVSRTKIALGKIFSLSIIALISGASSVVGTLVALPKLMEGSGVDLSSVYTLKDYIMIALIILSSVIFIITLMSIISTYANTVKEAQMFATPFMMLAMAVGLLSSITDAESGNAVYMYFIPLYNSSLCLSEVFSLSVNVANIMISSACNIAYAGIGVFALTKMFGSEKIMFRK